MRVPRVVYHYWSTSSISSSLKPGSSDVVVDSLRDAKELPWREFLESSLTFRFCCLAVALAGRLLLEPALEVGARREREGWLPAFSYPVMCAPFRRLVPCSCREGIREGLGIVLAKSVPSLLVESGVRLAAATARAACLPACLTRLILAFVGRIIRLSLTLGLAGQLSWLALWGP